MSNNTIYEKIGQKAHDEASIIIDNAKSTAKIESDRLINDAIEITNHQIELVNEKINEERKGLISSLSQKEKQQTLIMKKNLIHRSFTDCVNELTNFTDEELTTYVFKYISLSNVKGNETVYVNSSDYDRYVKLFSTSKEKDDFIKLDIINKKFNFDLSLSKKPVNISGGLILEGTAFDIDLSFEETLRITEALLEKQIADLMFDK